MARKFILLIGIFFIFIISFISLYIYTRLSKDINLYDILQNELVDINHKKTQVKSLKNMEEKYILVNFFASWCIACIEEHATLLEVAKSKDIYMIGIAYNDDKKNLLQYLEKFGNPFDLILLNTDIRDFGVNALPETFVFDRNSGNFVLRISGKIQNENIKNIIK